MESTTQSKTATQTRVITVVTTRGEKVKFNFEGAEWSDLKKILERGGTDIDGKKFSSYDLGNMKCVESIRRSTLEHPNAVVPNENFNLFLMPLRSKSGGMTRTEIYTQIQKHIKKDGDTAKNHFSDNGKNYTMVGSAILEEKLESYAPGTKAKATSVKKEAIADVVASVKKNKEPKDTGAVNLKEELSRLSVDEKLDFIIDMLVDIKGGGVVAAPAGTATEETAVVDAKPAAPVETPEAKAAREAKEAKEKADREENEKLEKEMAELSGGFNDVKRY